MKQLTEDLWQSTKYSQGILNSHAYLLQRPGGNVLFYNTGNDDDLDQIAALGGIRYQLLTHRDEAGPSLQRIKERFGSQLACSALEVPTIGKSAAVDIQFQPADSRLEDIEIIHTPGHTDGSLCFFYRSPYGKSYLFTGDTLFQWEGKWSTIVIPDAGGSEVGLFQSLQTLRTLRPDMVMSSGFVGELSEIDVSADQWLKIIDKQLGYLTHSG